MPMVGYGTWPLKGYSCYGAVMDAVKAGYRHFDTAQAYGNERNIGQALSQALTDRVVTRCVNGTLLPVLIVYFDS